MVWLNTHQRGSERVKKGVCVLSVEIANFSADSMLSYSSGSSLRDLEEN